MLTLQASQKPPKHNFATLVFIRRVCRTFPGRRSPVFHLHYFFLPSYFLLYTFKQTKPNQPNPTLNFALSPTAKHPSCSGRDLFHSHCIFFMYCFYQPLSVITRTGCSCSNLEKWSPCTKNRRNKQSCRIHTMQCVYIRVHTHTLYVYIYTHTHKIEKLSVCGRVAGNQVSAGLSKLF